jgi:hypothetical protein
MIKKKKKKVKNLKSTLKIMVKQSTPKQLQKMILGLTEVICLNQQVLL